MKLDQKYYPEFHRLFKGNIVEVCEGEGTEQDPCKSIYYIYQEDGKFIGRLDTTIGGSQIREDGARFNEDNL